MVKEVVAEDSVSGEVGEGNGQDFETRCNQRKIFMGRVIEIMRARQGNTDAE